MELVVVSPLSAPVKLLTQIGFKPRHLIPAPEENLTTIEPGVYGEECLKQFLSQGQDQYRQVFLLALSTFMVYRQRRVHQPRFKMDVLANLKLFSGHTYSIVTYFALKHPRYQAPTTGSAETKITLKILSDHFLTGYVNDHQVTHQPTLLDLTDPATYALINRIDGSLSNLIHQLPIEMIDLSELK